MRQVQSDTAQSGQVGAGLTDTSSLSHLQSAFASDNPPRRMFPLLWLHGDETETEAVLRDEIARMDEGGAGGFVIESRPHADYLGDGWWRDVSICLDEASQRNMQVYIFDEEYYPSGIAGGRVLAKMPDARMQVLVRTRDKSELTEVFKVIDGPDGERYFIGLRPSWSGRMYDKMVDYLRPDVTDAFIEITYESTRQRFGHLFGETIKGFFGDETSFENFASYDYLFGAAVPCFPWSQCLSVAFLEQKGYDLLAVLEGLWMEPEASGDWTDADAIRQLHVDYMDVLTKLFAQNFFGRIEAWCHQHGLEFIGHVVEDNNAHMHHGYGVGHFFRAVSHFNLGGYDLVLRQLDSDTAREPYEELYPQFDEYRTARFRNFFRYTVAALAQSAAHLVIGCDRVMCENFGAYGWDLGLREMKWMTDWQTARGTNWYVPHAFSPLFPDSDCPPHFYARGNNPEWPFFRQWANYANRSCLMLSDACHVSEVAVLYPAEAHWAGDMDRLDEVCAILTQNQYDFDILDADTLARHGQVEDGCLRVRDHQFRAVVIPGLTHLPREVEGVLAAFAAAGGNIISNLVSEPDPDPVPASVPVTVPDPVPASVPVTVPDPVPASVPVSLSVSLPALVPLISRAATPATRQPNLVATRYTRDDADIVFLRNESPTHTIHDVVEFPFAGKPEFWHALDGRMEQALVYDLDVARNVTTIPIRLEPYEAVFVVFPKTVPDSLGSSGVSGLRLSEVEPPHLYSIFAVENGRYLALDETTAVTIPIPDWEVVQASSPFGVPDGDLPQLGNWLEQPGWEDFCGTVTYRAQAQLSPSLSPALLRQDSSPGTAALCHLQLDLGDVGEIAQVEVNGKPLPTRICPPYTWNLGEASDVLDGNLSILVRVTNTLGPRFRSGGFERTKPFPAGLLQTPVLRGYEVKQVFFKKYSSTN